MGNAHTYPCAAVLTLNKHESGHNVGTGRGPSAGGADHASKTPGAMSRKGTNQEREVSRPTLTVSASIHERALDDAARAAVVDRWRHDIEPHHAAPHGHEVRGLQDRAHGPGGSPLAGPATAAREVRC